MMTKNGVLMLYTEKRARHKKLAQLMVDENNPSYAERMRIIGYQLEVLEEIINGSNIGDNED